MSMTTEDEKLSAEYKTEGGNQPIKDEDQPVKDEETIRDNLIVTSIISGVAVGFILYVLRWN